jgi:hypothetical protein
LTSRSGKLPQLSYRMLEESYCHKVFCLAERIH